MQYPVNPFDFFEIKVCLTGSDRTVLELVHWYLLSEVCTSLPLSRTNVYEERSKPYVLDTNDYAIAEGQITINNTYDVVTNQVPGMIFYGIAVFTVLNSMCFLTVLICYTGLFITVIQTSKRAGRARNLKEERKMAIKMGVIVMTDLLCWTPILSINSCAKW